MFANVFKAINLRKEHIMKKTRKIFTLCLCAILFTLSSLTPIFPQIGDIHKTEPIEIHFDTVVTSAAGLAGLIVGNGIGAGIAIILAIL